MTEAVWPALADPTRRALLALLCERPRSVGELVECLAVSQPAVSKHLRVLRSAGLVHVTGDAQRRIYSVNPAPFLSLDAWLEPFRRLWNDRLDRLGQHLDAHPHPAAPHADHPRTVLSNPDSTRETP